MNDLLELVTSERADALELHTGEVPLIVTGGERHAVEGPVITAENGEQLLRSIANTRQIRALMKSNATEFIYTYRGLSRFVVRANIKGENVNLELQRCTVF